MEAFRTIVEKHHPILYKIGRSYTRTSADFDDLYQEMLIQLHTSLRNFNGESSLSTWIYRVALNTALTYHRNESRRSREMTVEEVRDVDGETETGHAVSRRDRQIESLYESINELSREDRALILLHLEGKSYREIAEILGISNSNTGVRILRSKKKLKELLIRKGYERD